MVQPATTSQTVEVGGEVLARCPSGGLVAMPWRSGNHRRSGYGQRRGRSRIAVGGAGMHVIGNQRAETVRAATRR